MITQASLDGLRAIRLHHWRKVENTRHMQNMLDANITKGGTQKQLELWIVQRRRMSADWKLHMGYVQTLNDFFDIGDTAERDATKARKG